MYFWLFFCGENGIDNIAVKVASLEKLLDLAFDILDILSQDIFLFLFVDKKLIDNNEYLETSPAWTHLFICKPSQKEKILIYFEIKSAIAACQSM